MAAGGQDRSDSSAYRPTSTSIDYINLPNPIQPAPESQKHPLNGTPHLEKARLESNGDLFRLPLLASSNTHSSKRPRPAENLHLDLPRLPVRNNAKRLRIPPTLSGLHQPPPDAGLLPSINVEQPINPPPRSKNLRQPEEIVHAQPNAIGTTSTSIGKSPKPRSEQSKSVEKHTKRVRNKWTVEETEDLLKDYHFNNRTALDLKDRFRICFPDHKKKERTSRSPSKSGESTSSGTDDQQVTAKRAKRGPASERVAASTLERLGINKPFEKTQRRSRHSYSTAEDEALLRGFEKHGKAWTAIAEDPEVNLSGRKPTDLRDRMRTRYPSEYAKSGLAPRVKKPATAAQTSRVDDDASDEVWQQRNSANTRLNVLTTKASTSSQVKSGAQSNPQAESSAHHKSAEARRPHQPSLFSLDDIYLARLSDEEDAEHERITLDRGILDWAPSTARHALADTSRPPDINPSMLTLPKRIPPMHAPDPPLSQGGQGNNTTSLPSLASLVPLAESNDNFEQFEQLPSLTEWWVPHQENQEHDSRSGGATHPSLEDILSSAL